MVKTTTATICAGVRATVNSPSFDLGDMGRTLVLTRRARFGT